MSDPAVEAAIRAFDSLWPDQGDFEFNFDSSTREYAVRSAREALKPLRQLHRRTERNECATCLDPRDSHWLAPWPCDTAKLIYPEGELS